MTSNDASRSDASRPGPQPVAGDGRQARQLARQRAITQVVMTEGSIRIEQLAERFDISLMTVHRDLDELESTGVLRKSRGVATAMSSSLVESSDVYRSSRQLAEKESLAIAALDFVEPGQAIFLDDSTTVIHMARHLANKVPLTVITNVLTLMTQLRDVRGLSLIALGGEYHHWCSAYMGRLTHESISRLRADTLIMSAAAITDDTVFHQALETVDVKRAMFDSSARRILLADHTKFGRRALHALLPLRDFDIVIVDAGTAADDVVRLRSQGIEVVIAPQRYRDERDATTHAD